LDLMEQSTSVQCLMGHISNFYLVDFGSAGKPWANAYMGHVRVLAPIWRSSYTTTSAAEWTGFLVRRVFRCILLLMQLRWSRLSCRRGVGRHRWCAYFSSA
jgi:hypothetical protein